MRALGTGLAIVALCAAGLASIASAHADVKAGVAAWDQGDYARAVQEWRPLAEAGDADAQFNMGQAYKSGRGVPMDENVALDWFRKAAIQGHARAEDNYGRLLFQTGKRAEAMPYIRKSADRGDPRGQYILGTAYFNGEFVGKDWPRAYALMSRAAASGLAPAATSLAQMDQYIPADQRRKGLALASEMERTEKNATLAGVEPAVPAIRPGPKGDGSPVIAPAKPTPPVPAPAPRPVPAKPTPAPAKPTPPVTATGGWRVQMGAFSEDGRAQALWAQLSKRVSGLSSHNHYLVKGGGVTRLQAGPVATQAEAETLCRAIKATGTDCLIKKM